MSLIRDINQIFKNYQYNTKILVASVRHPIHVIESAKVGADVVTLPPRYSWKNVFTSSYR